MAQIATIALLLNDAVTSVDFDPVQNNNLLAVFQEDDLTKSVDLRKSVTTKLRPGSNTIKRKVTVKTQLPYRPAAVDGVTQKIEMIESINTFNVPLSASTSDIEDLVALQSNATAATLVRDILVNGRAPV